MKFVRDESANNLIPTVILGIMVLLIVAALLFWLVWPAMNSATCSNIDSNSSWYRLAGCK